MNLLKYTVLFSARINYNEAVTILKTIDYFIFFFYIIVITGIGLIVSRRSKSEKEFFLAGRSLGWFPIGLSVMATVFSAINYTALPVEVFTNGLYMTVCLPVFLLITLPVVYVFIPYFYKMNTASAYEFLEKRFNVKVRALTSGLFIFWRIIWMAIALYASSQILALLTGIPLPLLILATGIAVGIYTVAGGVRAVIWTDVAQFFVMFGSIAVGLFLAVNLEVNGVSGVVHDAVCYGKLKPYVPYDPRVFSFDPTIRTTFWSGVIGTMAAFITRYGADQVTIQRYMSARSVKTAQKAFLWNIISALICLILLVMFGITIFSFAQDTGLLKQHLTPMQYMAVMINHFPSGGTGLLAAGLLAATMSSLDSGINACSAAWVKDFRDRFFKAHSDEFKTMMSSLCICVIVISVTFFFVPILNQRHTIFVMINRIIHGLGSPIAVVILLAMFSRKVTANGVFWGGACRNDLESTGMFFP